VLIEIWLPRSVRSGEEAWTGADRVGLGSKKGHSDLVGGYYAARLAFLERLSEMRRQASAHFVRKIAEKYWAPLGIWSVRGGPLILAPKFQDAGGSAGGYDHEAKDALE
jgi:hypothetical protein